jgi:hypothetical protein
MWTTMVRTNDSSPHLAFLDQTLPSVDIIEIETIARLRHLSFDKIDYLHILPRSIRPAGYEMGILRRWHFR